MNWWERIFLVAWLGFCFSMMTEGILWGGDCSSPGDCSGIPDNGSRAAAVGGAIAGGGLAYRKHKKKKERQKKPDPCAGLQKGYEEAKSALETLNAKMKHYAEEYNKEYDKLKALDAQSKLVKDEAMSEWNTIKELDAAELGVSLVADIISAWLTEIATLAPIEVIPADPIARYIYTGHEYKMEGVQVPPVAAVFDAAEKLRGVYEFWKSQEYGLNVDKVREWMNEWRDSPLVNIDALEQFLNLLEEMQSVIAKMTYPLDKYDELLVEKPYLEKSVAEAKAAWEACLSENR